MRTTIVMKKGFLGLAVALLVGASGCGQLSFMEVTVHVDNTLPQVDASCLFVIDQCEVTVSGAESDTFTLARAACSQKTVFDLTTFQFGTDESSGNITFKVDIFDGNRRKLGTGSATGAIKDGGRQPVKVPVAPDVAAFAATGACSPP